jgi:thiol-disulfide isomerase/thioredoxin
MSRKFINICSLLFPLILIMAGCQTEKVSSDDRATQFPTFSLLDMEGNTVTNEIFVQNELTLVNVWATFCGPCINEMPELEAISREYKDTGVTVLGIVADGGSAAPQAYEMLRRLDVSYVNLLPNSEFTDEFLSREDAVPYSLLVNNESEVLEFVMGSRDGDTFRQMIDRHLK